MFWTTPSTTTVMKSDTVLSSMSAIVNHKFSVLKNPTSIIHLAHALDKLASVDPDAPLLVVSIIGKSRKSFGGGKGNIIDEAIGRNIFQGKFGDEEPVAEPFGSEIEGYYDEQRHIVFLHALTALDSDILTEVTKKLHREIHDKGFPSVWSEIQTDMVKALLLVFLVSHVVVVSIPSIQFDLSLIPLFKTIDAARVKIRKQVSSALSDVAGLPKKWIEMGRPCSPRVLFYFEGFDQSPDSDLVKNRRKYELLLEDQIYRFLRRGRVITNICTNSLFAVCNQMDFVFLATKDSIIRDPHSFMEKMMHKFCDGQPIMPASSNKNDDSHSFYTFLWSHLNVAETRGFDDNVGRHNVTPVFERPNLSSFFTLLKNLRDVLFEDSSMDDQLLEDNLRNLINSDSENYDDDDYEEDDK